jgi:hypothetical protein
MMEEKGSMMVKPKISTNTIKKIGIKGERFITEVLR